MSETVRFERRYQGFADGALGGYAAGVAARGMKGPAEANLRALPPLDRELGVHRDGERVELRDGDAVVVEAAPARFELRPRHDRWQSRMITSIRTASPAARLALPMTA